MTAIGGRSGSRGSGCWTGCGGGLYVGGILYVAGGSYGGRVYVGIDVTCAGGIGSAGAFSIGGSSRLSLNRPLWLSCRESPLEEVNSGDSEGEGRLDGGVEALESMLTLRA